jgi:hypothetical protein
MTDTPQSPAGPSPQGAEAADDPARVRQDCRACAAEGVDYPRFLLRLVEAEIIERERRMVDRRIKAAKFPTVKSLDSFDFPAFPTFTVGHAQPRTRFLRPNQPVLRFTDLGRHDHSPAKKGPRLE